MKYVLLGLAFLAFTGAARADEIIDGDNPPTVRNNMHVCPPGRIVTGFHSVNNELLCTGPFANGQSLVVNERIDAENSSLPWPDNAVVRTAHNYTGPDMHWCGPDSFITGIHEQANSFSCASFASGGNRSYNARLGHFVVDTATQRSGMHACPRGTILVGAHLDSNRFLCAGLPFCEDNSQCPSSFTCELNSVPCAGCGTGVCRRQGSLVFQNGNACGGSSVGTLTDRSGSSVRFNVQPGFTNDAARSLRLDGVLSGTVIRIFDDAGGSTGDDWTQIFVKNSGTPCLASFEGNTFEDASLRVERHPFNGLDGRVSRVEVQSAILDLVGRRCLDVPPGTNTVQLFGCHAGENQRWTYEVSGEIRTSNGRCLETNSAEIHTWPNLTAGQVRQAGVRTALCNGSTHQKWKITEAQEIRMFSDMCLDIVGGSGSSLQIYPCHGGTNQRWVSSF